ncbi:MAG: tellurite resistance-related uncharacterized protein [Gammaproteobacteria bacterium]|jgi:tellurite resistance-related uncharacterized protein
MKSLPANVVLYKQTPEFDARSIPPGLQHAHATREGTWGLIVVSEGELMYRILDPVPEELRLSPQLAGVIEPAISHEVSAPGNVRFHIEFYRQKITG